MPLPPPLLPVPPVADVFRHALTLASIANSSTIPHDSTHRSGLPHARDQRPPRIASSVHFPSTISPTRSGPDAGRSFAVAERRRSYARLHARPHWSGDDPEVPQAPRSGPGPVTQRAGPVLFPGSAHCDQRVRSRCAAGAGLRPAEITALKRLRPESTV